MPPAKLPVSLLKSRAVSASLEDAWISRHEAAAQLGIPVRTLRRYEDRHVRVLRDGGRVYVARADLAALGLRLGRRPDGPEDAAISRALVAGSSADAIVSQLGADYQQIAAVTAARDRLMAHASVPLAWLEGLARILEHPIAVAAGLVSPELLESLTAAARTLAAESRAFRLADRRRDALDSADRKIPRDAL